MSRLTTLAQWQIIGPDGPVGGPGTAYAIYQECSRLNDEANPDPAQIRQVLYRVERALTLLKICSMLDE